MVSSASPTIREAGIEFLARTAPRDCASVLVEGMLATSQREVRSSLARAYVDLERAEVCRGIHRLFNGKKSEHRLVALEIVAADKRWREHIKLLKQAVRDEEQRPARRCRAGAAAPDQGPRDRDDPPRGYCTMSATWSAAR